MDFASNATAHYKRMRMHNNMDWKSSNFRQDIFHISILITIVLCVGIYLINTTVIISKDGVSFIEYAKDQIGRASCWERVYISVVAG